MCALGYSIIHFKWSHVYYIYIIYSNHRIYNSQYIFTIQFITVLYIFTQDISWCPFYVILIVWFYLASWNALNVIMNKAICQLTYCNSWVHFFVYVLICFFNIHRKLFEISCTLFIIFLLHTNKYNIVWMWTHYNWDKLWWWLW